MMKGIQLIYQDRVYQDEWVNGKDLIDWGKFDNEAVDSLLGNHDKTPPMQRRFIFWGGNLTNQIRQSKAVIESNKIIERLLNNGTNKDN